MVEMCVEAVAISIGLSRSSIFRSIYFLVKSKTTYRIINEICGFDVATPAKKRPVVAAYFVVAYLGLREHVRGTRRMHSSLLAAVRNKNETARIEIELIIH